MSRFIGFFDKMGVKHEVYRKCNDVHGRHMIVVAQALFFFDADEVYVGVQCDEMGYFDERIER